MSSIMARRAQSLESRKQAATAIIASPTHSNTELAKCVGISRAMLYYYLNEERSVEHFLKKFAPAHLQEKVQETARVYCSTHNVGPRGRGDEAPAPVVAPVPALPSYNSKALGRHECQWLTSHNPPCHCAKTVVGLYCETHDIIAKREEAARFKKVHSR